MKNRNRRIISNARWDGHSDDTGLYSTFRCAIVHKGNKEVDNLLNNLSFNNLIMLREL